jgi:hypothetical protein
MEAMTPIRTGPRSLRDDTRSPPLGSLCVDVPTLRGLPIARKRCDCGRRPVLESEPRLLPLDEAMSSTKMS